MGISNISNILDLDSYVNSWHILENKGQIDAFFVANKNIYFSLVSWYLNQRIKNLEDLKSSLSARFLLDNDLIGKSKSNAYSFIKKKEKLGLNEIDIPDSVYMD